MSVMVATEHPFKSLTAQMGKFMEQMQKGYSNFAPGEVWTPCVNLYETEGAYLVCVDLAGVEKEKIEITVEQHSLKLRGRRVVPIPDGNVPGDPPDPHHRLRVHVMEIDHGSFSREVELPLDVREDAIAAQYRNGLLWIELPKKTDPNA
jgi:HSP20 family protein